MSGSLLQDRLGRESAASHGAPREGLCVGDLMNGNLRLGRHKLQQAARECVEVPLGEVTVERLAVGPLFDRDELSGASTAAKKP